MLSRDLTRSMIKDESRRIDAHTRNRKSVQLGRSDCLPVILHTFHLYDSGLAIAVACDIKRGVVCGTVVATRVMSGASTLLILQSATRSIKQCLKPNEATLKAQLKVTFAILWAPAGDDIGENVPKDAQPVTRTSPPSTCVFAHRVHVGDDSAIRMSMGTVSKMIDAIQHHLRHKLETISS